MKTSTNNSQPPYEGTAHSKIRALLVNGNHMPVLGLALEAYKAEVSKNAGKSFSQFVGDAKKYEEFHESWKRAREALDDLQTQVRNMQWQMEDEEKAEIWAAGK
jgi:hypothetical protein